MCQLSKAAFRLNHNNGVVLPSVNMALFQIIALHECKLTVCLYMGSQTGFLSVEAKMQLPFNYLSGCISQLTKKTPSLLHRECNVQQKQEEMQKRNPFVSCSNKVVARHILLE
jgi:hypothetical protein